MSPQPKNSLWHTLSLPLRIVAFLLRPAVNSFRHLGQEARAFFTEEPEDTPLPDAVAAAVANPGGMLEHFNALRRHLFRSLVVVMLTTSLSFTFVKPVLEFLARPIEGGITALRAVEVTESLGTVMQVALLTGFALAFPYIVLELWVFIGFGLKRRTRLMGLLAVPVAMMFLLMGMAFTYFVMLPVALPFLLNFIFKTEARPSSYFSFVISLMFWVGLAFEFPLVILILARLGLVRASMLLRQWRVAIVVIAIVAAIVTPTTDPVNMGLVMAPLLVLYFLGILLAALARRERRKPS